MLMVLCAAVVALSVVALASSVLVSRSEARAAADTAAVAAAWSLRLGDADPCGAARDLLGRYDGDLTVCEVRGEDVLIEVGMPMPLGMSSFTRVRALAGPGSCEDGASD